jgi:hypothetical protein
LDKCAPALLSYVTRGSSKLQEGWKSTSVEERKQFLRLCIVIGNIRMHFILPLPLAKTMPQHRYEIWTMNSISGHVYITEAQLRKIDGYQPLQLFDIDINGSSAIKSGP